MTKKRKKKPAKMGRPSSFSEKLVAYMCQLAEQGKTDEEIALCVGVDVRTLYRWKSKRGDFDQALRTAKDIADDSVEQALYARACGYAHKSVKLQYDQERGEWASHELIERYPPDTGAAIAWLKNRKPKEWKEKVEMEHSGKVTLEDLVAKAGEPEKKE